jgi:cysteine-rich repeat protein
MRNTRWISTGSLVWLALGCGGDSTTVVDDTTGTSGTDGPTDPSTTMVAEETTAAQSTGEETTAADESTTEEASLCGNGELDPGEACDDGNDEWLDACRPDCTHAYEVLWTHSYDGPASFHDVFADVVVDESGTIYVAGTHVVEGTRRELLVKAYSAQGREGWSFSWRGGGDGPDHGRALARLPGGDLVICGLSTTDEHGEDFLVMRVTPGEAEPVWVREYNGPNVDAGDDWCASVAVDAAGDIIAVGSEKTTASGGWDIVVRKVDEDGELLWSRGHGDPFDGGDFGLGVGVDSDLNVVVLGRVREAAGLNRAWLRRYLADGTEQWTYRSGVDGSENWWANDVALDAVGEILLTGTLSSNVVTTKLDADAEEVWRHEASNGSYGNGVTVDADGRVAVAGTLQTMSEGADVWAGGFDETGAPRWGFTYGNEVLKIDDWGNAVAIDHEGDVIVVGVETVLGQQRNGWIRKIRPVWD